jgi:tetratricopeptide (TPR) repeat protein
MRKLTMTLAAASLLICAAPYGRTNPIPGTLSADKLQKATMAEEKGDLECIRGNYQWAAYEYRDALHLSPQNPMFYNKLGIAQMKLHDLGEARKSFREALKYDPHLIPALNNLGAVALLQNKYRPAANYFKEALALDESVAATHVNLAEAWIGQHKIDRAMTEYARALELDTDILSNNRSGDFAQVTTPEQRARISYLIAKAYVKRGNLDGAIEYLQQAKDGHFPDLAQVYTDPAFAALWKDPRLAKIVRR